MNSVKEKKNKTNTKIKAKKKPQKLDSYSK